MVCFDFLNILNVNSRSSSIDLAILTTFLPWNHRGIILWRTFYIAPDHVDRKRCELVGCPVWETRRQRWTSYSSEHRRNSVDDSKTNDVRTWGSSSSQLTRILSREFFRISSFATSMQFQSMANCSNSVRWAFLSFLLTSCNELTCLLTLVSSGFGLLFCCFLLSISSCSASFRSMYFCRATRFQVREVVDSFVGSPHLCRYYERSFRRGSCPCPSWRCWCSSEQLVEGSTSLASVHLLVLCRWSCLPLSISWNHLLARELVEDPISTAHSVFWRYRLG